MKGAGQVLGPIFGFDVVDREPSGPHEILAQYFHFEVEQAVADGDDPIGLGLPPISDGIDNDNPLGIY